MDTLNKKVMLCAIESTREAFARIKKQKTNYSCIEVENMYARLCDFDEKDPYKSAAREVASDVIGKAAKAFCQQEGFQLEQNIPQRRGNTLSGAFAHDISDIKNERLWDVRQRWLNFLQKWVEENA